MSFSQQIQRFGKNAQAECQRVRRGVTIKLLSAVVRDTPVLTGRLRANWQISEGAPVETERGVVASNKNGSIAKGQSKAAVDAEINALVQQSTGDKEIFLTNNLPYAHRIEFDGWSHTKAPEGMVRRNVIRFGRLIRVVVKGGFGS